MGLAGRWWSISAKRGSLGFLGWLVGLLVKVGAISIPGVGVLSDVVSGWVKRSETSMEHEQFSNVQGGLRCMDGRNYEPDPTGMGTNKKYQRTRPYGVNYRFCLGQGLRMEGLDHNPTHLIEKKNFSGAN